MSFCLNSLSDLDRQTAEDVSLEKMQTYDVMQFKYDGIWCALSDEPEHLRPGEGNVKVLSRNGLLKERILINSFPENTVVAGEFMYGSQWAQNSERLGKVFCFDLIMLHNEDMRTKSYLDRYGALVTLLKDLNHPRLKTVNTFASASVPRCIEALKRNRAYEGVVGRNWADPYEVTIGRLKLDLEDDFVIMGVYEGEGRLVGMLGGFIVGQYLGDELVEVMHVGGGISDVLRRLVWNNPSAYLHKVIKVSGKMRFTSGAFRHPNFECFREDKSPKECRITKQFTSVTTE